MIVTYTTVSFVGERKWINIWKQNCFRKLL